MRALRIGICVVIAGSVLAFGSADTWSVSLVEIAAALLLILWAFLLSRNGNAAIRWIPLFWPLLGLIAIGLFQLLFRLTAYPFLTRTDLLKLASYFLIVFLATQAFQTRDSLSKLSWFLILFCFGIALFGIAQYFTSNHEIYWMSKFQVNADAFGPYVNRNHFAGFLELTLPVSLAMMAFGGVRRDLLALTGLLAVVPIGALVLSGSRGGIIGFCFEIGILLLLMRTRHRKSGNVFRLMAAGVVVLVALAFVAWIGIGRAVEKFSALNSHEASVSRRLSMARGGLHMFATHPIWGSGLGTLVSVYPLYETVYDGRLVDHVHDDYVEGLAETGLLGGICGVAFLWLLFRDAKKNFLAEQGHFSRAVHAGAIVAVSGMLLHSFVDFNLHIPANALLFLLQVQLATSPPLASSAPPRIRMRSQEPHA
jgi:O-antigen ligase